MPAPVGLVLGADRGGGDAVLAEELAGDPLHQLGRARRVLEHHQIEVTVRVDEAGRKGRARAIDLEPCSSVPERTDGGDAVALDGEIPLEPGAPGSVEDPRALEQHVEAGVLGHEGDSLASSCTARRFLASWSQGPKLS